MTIFFDTSALSYTYFTIPNVPAFTAVVDGSTKPGFPMDPGTYGFQQYGQSDWVFLVTDDGTIDYDANYDTFLGGRGTDTLILLGYTVTFDATALDHDLQLELPAADALSRDTVHQLTLLPVPAYAIISSGGIVADFTFGLDVSGNLIVDSAYAGFATAENSSRTLTITGYPITFDGTLLTHGLYPQLLGYNEQLTRDATHTLTIIPASAYAMVVDSGILGNFRYSVNTDGTVGIPDEDKGFMVVEGGSTLVFWGYPVEIDTRQAGASLAVAPTTRWHGLQVLMPANWAVETSNGTFWLLILDLDGAISGDPDMPNAYEVSTVPRLALVAA